MDDSLLPVDRDLFRAAERGRDRSNLLAIIESGLLDFSPV